MEYKISSSINSDDHVFIESIHTPYNETNVSSSTSDNCQNEISDSIYIVKAPIIGHEVVEQRGRFTVFKIRVERSDSLVWFVFRRFSDFSRLDELLREKFPGFRFALPPKKWFGDNFDVRFIDDRKLGLEAFLKNILSNDKVRESNEVKLFLCLEEPPGPYDSLEESRALNEALEEQLYKVKEEIKNKNIEISLLKEELAICKDENHALRCNLQSDIV